MRRFLFGSKLGCVYIYIHMGGCQNYGPFLDPHYSTAPNI